MIQFRSILRLGAALCLIQFALSTVSAQATRTWVSGDGDDVNPGTRTEPCHTFAGAISRVADGGEINCIDAGGYAPFTIVKSIIIDGSGTHAAILNSQTNGIIIKGDGIVVTIRNLSIQGAGKGVNGIKVVNCAVLNVENCVIANQTGQGIEIVPGSNARVFIKDTIIRGNEPKGGGIKIAPEATFSVSAFLDNVRLEGNLFGLLIMDRVTATARNCAATGNSSVGFLAAGVTDPVNLTLENCLASGNGEFGIRNSGNNSSCLIRLSNVTVTGNATGVSASDGSVIRSFGNNRLDGNTADGQPTETKPPQ